MLKPSVQIHNMDGILVAEFWDCLRLDPAPVQDLRKHYEAHLQARGGPSWSSTSAGWASRARPPWGISSRCTGWSASTAGGSSSATWTRRSPRCSGRASWNRCSASNPTARRPSHAIHEHPGPDSADKDVRPEPERPASAPQSGLGLRACAGEPQARDGSDSPTRHATRVRSRTRSTGPAVRADQAIFRRASP